MRIPATVDQFVELVSKSGLLDAQHLQTYLQRHPATGERSGAPKALANAMVRDGVLTRFQADQLLGGKWRNFILSGKYKVLGPLGSGGMGHVYLCEHQIMRRRVAVKVLPLRSSDTASLERFHREARAVAQLKHNNIVGGYDIDRDGKLHFLVMEYVDGNTLQKIVKKHGPMNPLRAAHYIRQAALGLQHAHEAGLVHRDIKPSNLLLDRTGTIKVLDMGLARFFFDESDDLSKRHSESPVGTMDYMAPEQALDSHQVDIRADIYSLGATFYFLLAGHSPFQGRTAVQKLMCHQFEPPRPIQEINPEVPADLAAVLEQMMAKEPEERFHTPAEVADALAPWTQTPLPPPPLEEMPKLRPPARITPEGPSTPGLPASLYGATSVTPPPSGRDAETLPPAQAPSQPLLEGNLGGEPQARTIPVAGHRPKTEPRRGPASPPPSSKREKQITTSPAPSSPPVQRAVTKALPPPAAWTGIRRLHPLILAAAAVILLGGAASIALYKMIARNELSTGTTGSTLTGQSRPGLKLLIPAYFYPSNNPADQGMKDWQRILESPLADRTVVIVNVSSGPGERANADYAQIVDLAKRKGVTAIGYVRTDYGKRPLREVKEDVNRWVTFYPAIQGIFFDEQATSADQIHYYAELYEHVKKDRGLSLVVTNPGAICAEGYFFRPVADVVCMVEITKDFSSSYNPPPWTDHYPADRFAALLYHIASAAQMEEKIRQMRDKKIGYCFITEGKGTNPWGGLPPYWAEEVEAIRRANEIP